MTRLRILSLMLRRKEVKNCCGSTSERLLIDIAFLKVELSERLLSIQDVEKKRCK